MSIVIASFDIGKHNFSVYVESFNTKELYSLNLKNESICNIVSEVSKIGVRKLWRNISLIGDAPVDAKLVKKIKGRTYLNSKHFDNMTTFLDDYSDLWLSVNHVIIEEQRKQNIDCIKLAQHCYSYFQTKYNRRCSNPEYIPSTYKTQKLGAPKIGLGKKKCVEDTNYNTSELKKLSLTVLKSFMRKHGIKGLSSNKINLVKSIREHMGCSQDNIITKFDAITLASYDIKTLREYLKQNGVVGKAKNKKEVIELIQNFNGIVEDVNITSNNRGRAIKQWSVLQAEKMLKLRNDSEAIDILLENKSKADDLADTFNQCQAYKICILTNMKKI